MSNNNIEFLLKDVRCSFPDIFKKSVYKGKETSYGTKIILDPENEHDAEILENIKEAFKPIAKDYLGRKNIFTKDDCLRDGNDFEAEDLQDKWRLSCNSPRQPHVFKPGSKEVAANMEESKIYSGCYVTAKIRLWGSMDQKTVNCQLIAIQFKRDGESFGAPVVPVEVAANGFEVSDREDFFDEAA